MSRPTILQVTALPDWDQGPLDAAFDMVRHFAAADKTAHLAEVGPRVRGIVTGGGTGAGAAMIGACPNLEIISVYGVGYDAVDLEACRARGVRVTNTPDVLTKDVADLAVAMMLAQARGVVGADAWVRQGHWAATGAYPLQRRAWGRRAGILGLGRIGFEVARRLAAFDMEISYCARTPKAGAENWGFVADPVELARRSDVLFVTLAATPDTRRIVSREVIAAMGPEGVIVNVSRGSTVDEEALIAALAERRLGGAALDVFEGEPQVDPRLLAFPNVLLQPHQASGTVATRRAMGALMRDNLVAHFAGNPLLKPVI